MVTQEGEKKFTEEFPLQEMAETPIEQRELDLNNPEDLEVFFESAQSVHAQAFEYFEVAEEENYKSLDDEDLPGIEIFETLQQKLVLLQEQINTCLLDILPNGAEIEDDQIKLMQELYDDMILLRDHIQITYAHLFTEDSNLLLEEELVEGENELFVEEKEMLNDTDDNEPVTFEVFNPQEVKTAEMAVDPLLKIGTFAETLTDKQPKTDLSSENLFKQTEQIAVESINLTQEHEEIVPNDNVNTTFPVMRKTMEISGEDEPSKILIHIAEKSEKLLEENLRKSTNEAPELAQVVTDLDEATLKATVITESSDPIDEIVPHKKHVIVHPKLINQEHIPTRKYLASDRYATYIKNNYTSPAYFERKIDAKVLQKEAKTVDFIEKFLNEERVSPFSFMEDMTVAEVEELSAQSNIRDILNEENIKYETFLSWVDLLPEMKQVVSMNSSIKFSELFTRYVVEKEMALSEEREAA